MRERSQRVMVFIDGSNLYYSMRERFDGKELDFERFSNRLSEGGELIRAYFFDARISRDKEAERHDAQAGFFDYLTHVPRLELRIVDLDYNGEEGPEQKAVDVGLAVLMVEHALRGNLDRAVLVSADRDFVPACQAVKDAGAIMDIATFEASDGARALRRVGDGVIQLDKTLLEGCWTSK